MERRWREDGEDGEDRNKEGKKREKVRNGAMMLVGVFSHLF